MNAITFINEKDYTHGMTVPAGDRAYAYKKDGYCILFWGENRRLYGRMSPRPALEKEQTDLDIKDWVKSKFGADVKIEEMVLNPGEVIAKVWRPGLDNKIEQALALDTKPHEQFSDKQALSILLEKLNDLLLYVEPSKEGLKSYSHKTRELLILSCTEVENSWGKYMALAGHPPAGNNYTTKDYVKLLKPLFLAEYEVKIKPYENLSFRPFAQWSNTAPTSTLPWYDAYNKTKHNRHVYFIEATLERCIEAVIANIIMFCVRYGFYDIGYPLFRQLFFISLANPDPKTFYVPNLKLNVPSLEAEGWITKPLII